MIGTAWAADAAGESRRHLLRSGLLGRRRLRAVLRAGRARSCGAASPTCSTSARRPSSRRWPTPSACATRRSRPSRRPSARCARAATEGGAILAAGPRGGPAHAGQGRGQPADRGGACASSRRSTASPSPRPPPPSRCATPPSTWRCSAHPRAVARAGRRGPQRGCMVNEAIARAAAPPALSFRLRDCPHKINRGLPGAPRRK